MGLVAVLYGGAVEIEVEVGGGLILMIAPAIDIVDAEAQACVFVGIDGKLGCEVVLAIVAVATLMLGDVGDGLIGVGEMPSLQGFEEKVIRLCKDEIVHLRAQGEHLGLAG